jgi:sodium/proline symporter
MTTFGIILRGVMPGIADPETGLSVFFQQNIGAVATGLIAADVFATIASTSNGLLIAMAQAANHDLIPLIPGRQMTKVPLAVSTLLIGAITMVVSIVIHGTVVTIALSSVSMMGAGLAAAVMIKVMHWPHTAFSLFCIIILGLVSAAMWKYFGYGSVLNEAAIGITVGLAANWLILRITAARTLPSSPV